MPRFRCDECTVGPTLTSSPRTTFCLFTTCKQAQYISPHELVAFSMAGKSARENQGRRGQSRNIKIGQAFKFVSLVLAPFRCLPFFLSFFLFAKFFFWGFFFPHVFLYFWFQCSSHAIGCQSCYPIRAQTRLSPLQKLRSFWNLVP